VFKQTSIFTVTSAAANNESLLAGEALGPDEDCYDSDELPAASDEQRCWPFDFWSSNNDSDEALSRGQRDRCRPRATPCAHRAGPMTTGGSSNSGSRGPFMRLTRGVIWQEVAGRPALAASKQAGRRHASPGPTQGTHCCPAFTIFVTDRCLKAPNARTNRT